MFKYFQYFVCALRVMEVNVRVDTAGEHDAPDARNTTNTTERRGTAEHQATTRIVEEWTGMNRNEQEWTGMDKNGQEWTKMDKNEQE